MRTALTQIALALLMASVFSGCRSSRTVASRSSDDVNICRQFIGEAASSMLALKRDTFHPRDLTFAQLRGLTPTDPDFVEAEFLVLNREWSPKGEKEEIVVVCTQGRPSGRGHRRYFAGYSSGNYDWVEEDVVAKLRLGDYMVLPRIR